MSKSKTIAEDFHHNESGVTGQYKTWFLDYASYVILERAVPAVEDGLKPVQRRILHSMKEMDDGRFNKVANIIGLCNTIHMEMPVSAKLW
jgi:topoisomerase-4 subunit A